LVILKVLPDESGGIFYFPCGKKTCHRIIKKKIFIPLGSRVCHRGTKARKRCKRMNVKDDLSDSETLKDFDW